MRKRLLFLFLFLFFSLSIFSSGLVESQDGLQYLAVARNIYYQHEPTAPPNEYEGGNKGNNIPMSVYTAKNGKTVSFTGLGFSLAMLPSVALTDIVYKIYNVVPPVHFPLENDWLIFLSTSFINIFFASLMGVILYLYFIEIRVKPKTALLITLLAIFTTNLFAFSKHINAHMMFSTFLLATIFFIKKYSVKPRKLFIYLAGVSFGIMMITYNNTFLLTVPAIVIYFLLLKRSELKKANFLKKLMRTFVAFILGILPFVAISLWFENFRAPIQGSFSSPAFLVSYSSNKLINVPITVLFEGLWGQLFSPGRSFFIYSPLILTAFIFWYKFKKDITPEVFSFLILAATYIVFYASFYSVGTPEQGIAALWAGESSWGPRYLAPLIAPGMLLVGYIFQRVTRLQKILVFLPLSLIGLYVEFLGVVMPYQIKYHYLQSDLFVNNTEYNVYSYPNLLPRYSAIIMQSKNLVRLIRGFRDLTIPGKYDVKMYDGISLAFDIGPERWRKIENAGYISFDNDSKSPVKEMSFDVINQPLTTTKVPLNINFEINGKTLLQKPVSLKIGEKKTVNLNLNGIVINDKDNLLIIHADYPDPSILSDNKQIPGLINMTVNGITVNKEYIWVPYISPLNQKILNVKYNNWGASNSSPWLSWDIHTQTFERLPDFWWFRNMFYWDVPKQPFVILLILDIAGILYFGYKLKKTI